MRPATLLQRTLGTVVALVVILLLVSQLLGQPILIGYVATGSMEPTMEAGDGFIAIPSVATGSVEAGDVIVFEARDLHDGGLTTHRVVGETDEGYVTKGDANPFTDQDGGEPHVTDERIVAEALQVNGDVVTIPHLGTAIMRVQTAVESAYGTIAPVLGLTAMESDGLGALLVAIGVALFGFGILLERFKPVRRETTRSRSRENVIAFWTALGLVLLVFVTFATAAMVVPSGTAEYGLVSTHSPTDDPQVLAPGDTTELTRTIDNAGYLPIVVVHEADRDDVTVEPDSQTIGLRSSGEATVSLTAPESTGEYIRHVGEYRYLAVLPPPILVWLHDVHPLAAIAGVNGVVVGFTVVLVLVVFGYGDFRIRSAGAHVPLSTRIERKFRKWL